MRMCSRLFGSFAQRPATVVQYSMLCRIHRKFDFVRQKESSFHVVVRSLLGSPADNHQGQPVDGLNGQMPQGAMRDADVCGISLAVAPDVSPDERCFQSRDN